MRSDREIAIIGYTLRSPCIKCPLHHAMVLKNRQSECQLCSARIQYDEIISQGWMVIPFIARSKFEKYLEAHLSI